MESKHIFVSHASQESELAMSVVKGLERQGYCAWISSRDIPPGASWDKCIERSLESAAAVILIATRNSAASDYVRAEIEHALSRNLLVVPLEFDDFNWPLRWSALQKLDCRGRSIENVIREITASLPDIPIRMIRSYLDEGGRDAELRGLFISLLTSRMRRGRRLQFPYASPTIGDSSVDVLITDRHPMADQEIWMFCSSQNKLIDEEAFDTSDLRYAVDRVGNFLSPAWDIQFLSHENRFVIYLVWRQTSN